MGFEVLSLVTRDTCDWPIWQSWPIEGWKTVSLLLSMPRILQTLSRHSFSMFSWLHSGSKRGKMYISNFVSKFILKHRYQKRIWKINENIVFYISMRSQQTCFHEKWLRFEGGVASAKLPRLRGRKLPTWTIVITNKTRVESQN